MNEIKNSEKSERGKPDADRLAKFGGWDMENQYRMISGHRELTVREIALMNEIHAKGAELEALINKVTLHIEDQMRSALYISPQSEREKEIERLELAQPRRWTAMARADFQVGIMKLLRAVGQRKDGL